MKMPCSEWSFQTFLNANDLITEEKLKNGDKTPDKYNYVCTYVFADNSILGTILRNENTNLDFRIDLEKQALELTDYEIRYSFDCYHDGYFYQVWPAENILDLIHPMIKSMYDKNVNPALYNLRETLLEFFKLPTILCLIVYSCHNLYKICTLSQIKKLGAVEIYWGKITHWKGPKH